MCVKTNKLNKLLLCVEISSAQNNLWSLWKQNIYMEIDHKTYDLTKNNN